VRLTHQLELLGNIVAASNSVGNLTVSTKILDSKSGFYMIMQVKYKGGMKTRCFSTSISILKMVKIWPGHSYNGMRIGTRMQFIK